MTARPKVSLHQTFTGCVRLLDASCHRQSAQSGLRGSALIRPSSLVENRGVPKQRPTGELIRTFKTVRPNQGTASEALPIGRRPSMWITRTVPADDRLSSLSVSGMACQASGYRARRRPIPGGERGGHRPLLSYPRTVGGHV